MKKWIGMLGAAAGLLACVHIIDPREAANTDIGLQVWVSVSPLTLSMSDTVTRMRVRVSAKNPGRDTIRVTNGGPACEVTEDPADGRGLLFSMRIGDGESPLTAGPAGDVCGTTQLIFPPRWTRRRDFYISVNDWQRHGLSLKTGDYTVYSYFAGYAGYTAGFTVAP